MRKIVIFTLILVALLGMLPAAQAAGSASLAGPDVVRAGDTITLTFYAGGGISGGSCTISYDQSQLTLQGYSSALSGTWKAEFNGNYILFFDDSLKNPLSGTKAMFKATFKVNASVTPGTNITVTAGGIRLSDGAADTVIGSRSYSATVAEPLSDNCQLSQLTVGNATISPAFSPNTTSYKASVPFTTAKLEVQAQAEHPAAKVSITNTQLAPGATTAVKITVTAENGATKVYTIQVAREQDPNYVPSSNAQLGSLEVAGQTLSPVFDAGKIQYYVWLPYETTEVAVTAAAADPKAKVTVGAAPQLQPGKGTDIPVTVTAEDGTVKTYTVTVVRAPEHGNVEAFLNPVPTEPTEPAVEENTEPVAVPELPQDTPQDDTTLSPVLTGLLGLALGGTLGALVMYLLRRKKK